MEYGRAPGLGDVLSDGCVRGERVDAGSRERAEERGRRMLKLDPSHKAAARRAAESLRSFRRGCVFVQKVVVVGPSFG